MHPTLRYCFYVLSGKAPDALLSVKPWAACGGRLLSISRCLCLHSSRLAGILTRFHVRRCCDLSMPSETPLAERRKITVFMRKRRVLRPVCRLISHRVLVYQGFLPGDDPSPPSAKKLALERKKPGQSSIRGYTNPVIITVRYSIPQMSDCSGLSRIARDPSAPSDSSMNRIPLSPRWGFSALPAIVLGHRFQWDAGLTLSMEILWTAPPPSGITGYRSQPPFSVGCAAYSFLTGVIRLFLSHQGESHSIVCPDRIVPLQIPAVKTYLCS